jgi:hypothetical protein
MVDRRNTFRRQPSTAVIDPKCDTCTKRATRKLLKTNSATISTDNRNAVCSEINAMKLIDR